MLGGKIRKLRRDRGLTQSGFAERLAISPSYLNLIEHNQRALTVPLLLKISRLLDVDLSTFSEQEDGRHVADVLEIAADPMFEDLSLDENEISEIVAVSPDFARLVVRCYDAYRAARQELHSLGERLSEDPFLSSSAHRLRTALTSMRSLSEILHDNADLPAGERQKFLGVVVDESAELSEAIDELLRFVTGEGVERILGTQSPEDQVAEFVRSRQNYFDEIEKAAVSLVGTAALEPGDLEDQLARYLARHFGVVVEETEGSGDEDGDGAADGRLLLPRVMPRPARIFRLGCRLGTLAAGSLFDEILAKSMLREPDAARLGREVLARYFAGAVLLPYDDFHAAAVRSRYDVEYLERRFRTSPEQVFQRLTTLQRPDAPGIPFHFLRIDIAGNIVKAYPGSGFRVPRLGGGCPRWNVHAAFMTPDRLNVELEEMPDGSAYLSIARVVSHGGVGYREAKTYHAIAIGCELSYAADTVYADGLDLQTRSMRVPVGPACRICERSNCAQRAHPSLIRAG